MTIDPELRRMTENLERQFMDALRALLEVLSLVLPEIREKIDPIGMQALSKAVESAAQLLKDNPND